MIHAKRYGRLLLWFIPAIAAFLNAQALKMRDRPPLEFVKPLTWRMEGTAHSGGRGAMPVFGYQAGQDFMAQGPAELHVSIRTGFLEVAPPFGLQIVRDTTAIHTRIEPTDYLPVIRLGKGYHHYSVFVYAQHSAYRMLGDRAHLSVRVLYPGTQMTQQLLCILGLGFLAIGVVQFFRIRRA